MISRSPIPKTRKKPRPNRLRGKAMASLRAQVFERDGYRCQHIIGWEDWPCEQSRVLESHPVRCFKLVVWERGLWNSGHLAHIVSRGRGGADTVENCTTKCGSCHIGIEHSYGPSGVKPCKKKEAA